MFEIKVDSNISLELLDLNRANEIFELGLKNKEEFIKWLPWVEETKSVENTKEFIKESLENFAEGKEINCSILYREQLVGNIALMGINKKFNIKRGEIGYWLDGSFQKRGIMSKAALKMIAIGFERLELNKIVIRCDKNNINSCNVARRLGFREDGLLRGEAVVNGKIVDMRIFSLLKGEYYKNKNIC